MTPRTITAEQFDAAAQAAAQADYEHVEQTPWAEAHRDDRADWLESARIGLTAALTELNITIEGN